MRLRHLIEQLGQCALIGFCLVLAPFRFHKSALKRTRQ